MGQEKKITLKGKYFNVIEVNGWEGIEPNTLNVIVMPFTRESTGLPSEVGVMREFNPLREDEYSITVISGDTEGEDPDLLATAIRELKEESGYDVQETERWYYLGTVTNSKLVMQSQPCFACDITGLTPEKAEGDGSEEENKSEFKLIPVREALNTEDVYVPSVFMKIFNYVFGFNVTASSETKQTGDNIDID